MIFHVCVCGLLHLPYTCLPNSRHHGVPCIPGRSMGVLQKSAPGCRLTNWIFFNFAVDGPCIDIILINQYRPFLWCILLVCLHYCHIRSNINIPVNPCINIDLLLSYMIGIKVACEGFKFLWWMPVCIYEYKYSVHQHRHIILLLYLHHEYQYSVLTPYRPVMHWWMIPYRIHIMGVIWTGGPGARRVLAQPSPGRPRPVERMDSSQLLHAQSEWKLAQ